MEKSITINNLKVKDIIDNLSVSFYKGINTFLCGTSGSGKTTLLKCISNSIEYKGTIKENNTYVIFKEINFETNSIEDEIKYKSLNSKQKKLVINLLEEEKLAFNPNNLCLEDKMIVLILKSLSTKCRVLIIDNLLAFIRETKKKLLLEFFKTNKIDIILVSNDIEDALLCDYMIVLDKGKIALEGKAKEVLKEEKILKRLGIGLPFYVDLSIQLNLYNLIDKVYLNKEELVGALWK